MENKPGGAPPTAHALWLAPGTLVGGSYRILDKLSQGGMGTVYVAEQISTQKRRALKLMQRHLVESARLRTRFEQEARISAKIESEHVVEVIDAGVDAELGVPFLAMELLEGETLAERCERQPLDAAEALDLFTQVGHALGAAHAAGIVHRDLKPDNIFLAKSKMVGRANTVKVLDFGIAKLVSDAAMDATQALGTPLYMPPEQMELGGNITPAADVWSLGLIAFYVLTGKTYWRSGNREDATPLSVLAEIAREDLVPASLRAEEYGKAARLPSGFDAWFAGAVDRSIANRYRNADLAVAALREVLARPIAPAREALNRTVAAAPFIEDAPPVLAPLPAPPAPSEPVEAAPNSAIDPRPSDASGGLDRGSSVGIDRRSNAGIDATWISQSEPEIEGDEPVAASIEIDAPEPRRSLESPALLSVSPDAKADDAAARAADADLSRPREPASDADNLRSVESPRADVELRELGDDDRDQAADAPKPKKKKTKKKAKRHVRADLDEGEAAATSTVSPSSRLGRGLPAPIRAPQKSGLVAFVPLGLLLVAIVVAVAMCKR